MIWTLISRSVPPVRSTSSTPSIRPRSSCRSSAIALRWSSLTSPASVMSTMGMSLKEISRIEGSSTSSGSFGLTRPTRSRTRCSASSMMVSGSNSTTTMETPSAEVDRITLMFLSEASSFSMGIEMRDSMSSGATPG